jgi:hypothetical protein
VLPDDNIIITAQQAQSYVSCGPFHDRCSAETGGEQLLCLLFHPGKPRLTRLSSQAGTRH